MKPLVFLSLSVLAFLSVASCRKNLSTRYIELLQMTSNGDECEKGKHLDDDKCVSNNDWCDHYNGVSFNCDECNFWTWTVNNEEQGNYCATHWWAVVLIILAILLGVALCCGLLGWLWMRSKKRAVQHEVEDARYDYGKGGHDVRVEDGVRGGYGGYGGKNQYMSGYNTLSGYDMYGR